ncbi:MAG: hypothetical protein ACXWKU_01035 [Caulobacteraceae bacterium]
MRKLCVAALVLAVGASLAGCKDKAPSGQVVAKVGNDEITVQELQAELNGYTAPDAKTRKLAEQRALQTIIERKLIAKAAVTAGVDKSPAYAIEKSRLEDNLMVQAWQKALVDAVPNPGPEQVKQYISQHPELFANHKVYLVDQVRMPPTNDQKLLADLKPLNTLEDIERMLGQHNIRFETGRSTMDSLVMGSQIATQVEKLPASEIFVIPAGNLLIANKIVESKVIPVPDNIAQQYATRAIKATQAQETVRRMFGSVVTNHPKVKVVYNKAYEPPADAPAAKGAAGAKKG